MFLELMKWVSEAALLDSPGWSVVMLVECMTIVAMCCAVIKTKPALAVS